MKQKKSIIFQLGLLVLLGVGACTDNRLDIELTNPEVDLVWNRLERDFTGLATKPSFSTYNDSLISIYGDFYSLYAERVMKFGAVDDPYFEMQVMKFLMHKDIHQLFRMVDSTFHDIDSYKLELEKGFRYYNYYFPTKQIPKVVSMVTAISNNIVVTDSVLGVGLDLYLGDSSQVYEWAGIPEYLRQKSTPEYMASDMMRGWILSEFEPTKKSDELLSQIINYGKGLYVMDAVFPLKEDYLKIGYTKENLQWCKDHEVDIWARLITENQLYSTDINTVRALTGPGPFTTGFTKDSPAQLGYWVGWQIVRKYMDENPEITLEELMQNEDAQGILLKSKYKPR